MTVAGAGYTGSLAIRSVFVAFKAIGQDLAVAFHGVGFREAWVVLEPYIRRVNRCTHR